MASTPFTGVNVDGLSPPSNFTVSQVTVGVSAVQLTGSVTPVKSQPVVKADPGNAGVVYVGTSSGVTTANGIGLGAGDALPIPVNDLSKIWFIASQASQKVGVIAGT